MSEYCSYQENVGEGRPPRGTYLKLLGLGLVVVLRVVRSVSRIGGLDKGLEVVVGFDDEGRMLDFGFLGGGLDLM